MTPTLRRLPCGLVLLSVLFPGIGAAAPDVVEDAPPATPEIMRTTSGIEMVRIPQGRLMMGSLQGEADEMPAHRVWVDAFLMDRTEVTQEVYGKLVLGNPSHFKGPRRPMEQVSWAAAALYCNARSRAEGLEPCYDEDTAQCNFEANGYRLPTEAEWEYACRAGTTTRFYFGETSENLPAYGWAAQSSSATTHEVAQLQPNAWGLYDMLGNVAEWCNDIYSETYYSVGPERNPTGPTNGDRFVIRGGAWNSPSQRCRSACRLTANPGFQDACFRRDDIGFRCVRSAP